MQPKLSVRNDKPAGPAVGLKDGGHVYLRCSNCNAILMDCWRTQPDAINPRTGKVFTWKIRANCPWCGDQSFSTEVTGVIHIGGYGVPKEDNEDDDIPSTSIDPPDFDPDTNTFTFNVLKANEHAKPVRN